MTYDPTRSVRERLDRFIRVARSGDEAALADERAHLETALTAGLDLAHAAESDHHAAQRILFAKIRRAERQGLRMHVWIGLDYLAALGPLPADLEAEVAAMGADDVEDVLADLDAAA